MSTKENTGSLYGESESVVRLMAEKAVSFGIGLSHSLYSIRRHFGRSGGCWKPCWGVCMEATGIDEVGSKNCLTQRKAPLHATRRSTLAFPLGPTKSAARFETDLDPRLFPVYHTPSLYIWHSTIGSSQLQRSIGCEQARCKK